MSEPQRARLIPVSGIGSVQEAEMRATSALLAVLTVVREFSDHLLSPLGASSARKAVVDAFTEVQYAVGGTKIRPDGLIHVTYGNRAPWRALVEVKTGTNCLEADQVNAYWDIARENGMDAIITISNEISPSPGLHPTAGLRVRANSPVQVHHLSWTRILSSAVMVKSHRGVEDVEQAWILGELIRYLQHPASGAMAFDDMGAEWVSVRNLARESALTPRTDGLADVVARWDQLLRFAGLQLGAEIGVEITQVLAKPQREPKARSQYLIDNMIRTGALDGVLRIPNTAGDLEVVADVKAQRLSAALWVAAPDDKGAVGRITWLVNQLAETDGRVVIESWAKNARGAMATATLGAAREDRTVLLDDTKSEPARFRIITRREMGQGRGTGKKSPGFIETVLAVINDHYEFVVQNIVPWQPKAPKVARKPTISEPVVSDVKPVDDTGVPPRDPVGPVPEPRSDEDDRTLDQPTMRLPAVDPVAPSPPATPSWSTEQSDDH